MNTQRFENWPNLLNDFIASREAAPFKWGTNDCCMFVCDEILAITGIDPASPDYRGHYDSALGAARLFNRSGGVEQIADAICKAQGFGECPVFFAQRGDPMLIDVLADGTPTDPEKADSCALGVCLGAKAAFVSPAGLVYHDVKKCRRAWRIF